MAGEVTSGTARVGQIELAYETFGSANDPAILLIMGLGTQMLAWADDFCAELADAGRYVIRYDNRDIGLSTHLDHLPTPHPAKVLLRREAAPYSITDMATDALGLLDVLDIARADVVGASMGGFIAQTLALVAPERVRSLTLIMTSTGSPRVGRPSAKAMKPLIFRRTPANRDEAIDMVVATFRRIGSPGYPLDEAKLRLMTARSIDRAYDPAGVVRQLAACLRQPDRTRALRNVTAPTLVVHGLADPLVAPSGGLALADAIPGATFMGFAGMGHDLPEALHGRIAHGILDNAARAADTPV